MSSDRKRTNALARPEAQGPVPTVPAQRVFLWALLVAGLLALAVATLWVRRGAAPSPAASGLPELFAIPDFALVDRDGKALSRRDLAGSPWIASFIFTRCGGVCPLIVESLKRLEPALAGHPDVARVSITVDPEYDTPAVMAEYARAHGIGDTAQSRWYFLTGPPQAVRDLILHGFKMALEAGATPEEPILHSTRLVLVDDRGMIRGFYEYDDPAGIARLEHDLDLVSRR